MADVEMTDAPAAAPAATKKGAAGDGEAKEGKKRFEVKKVNDGLPAACAGRLDSLPLTTDALVERRRTLGLGHRGRQLRHLQKPHHGSLYRMSSKPGIRYERGVHCCLGHLQRKEQHPAHTCTTGSRGMLLTRRVAARISLPLHLEMAQGPSSLPAGQQGLGIPKVWQISVASQCIATAAAAAAAAVSQEGEHGVGERAVTVARTRCSLGSKLMHRVPPHEAFGPRFIR